MRLNSTAILAMGLLLAGGAAAALLSHGGGGDRESVFVRADQEPEASDSEARAAPPSTVEPTEPMAVEPVVPEPPSTGAAQPATSPSVSVSSASGSAADSQNGLPKAVILRIVRQNRSRVRACYERGLSKNPELAGRIDVRFVISVRGDVSSASGKSSTLSDPEVVECVESVFRGMSFPEPDGGPVTVNYPFVFKPSD
jgi:hypothetical protein